MHCNKDAELGQVKEWQILHVHEVVVVIDHHLNLYEAPAANFAVYIAVDVFGLVGWEVFVVLVRSCSDSTCHFGLMLAKAEMEVSSSCLARSRCERASEDARELVGVVTEEVEMEHDAIVYMACWMLLML
jgi:hypothetical protein